MTASPERRRTVPPDRRAVVVAGHRGDTHAALSGLESADDTVRASALGALARCGALAEDVMLRGLRDPSAVVRARAATIAAHRPGTDLLEVLGDPDAAVAEVAAWACGEQERVSAAARARLRQLAADHADALVREAAVAALGAIGDTEAIGVIVRAAARDKPAVRRRAVLALAPFDGSEVEAALRRGLTDRDWQVRQAAEDLLAEWEPS